jgi:acyl-CoA thioesterase II
VSITQADPAAFLGMRRTGERSWSLPVTPEICSSLRTVFGGSAVAAGTEALEATLELPLRWATVQFLTLARPPDVLELAVDPVTAHAGLTQARLRARSDKADVFSVSAALGSGTEPDRERWAAAPRVLPPHRCPPRPKPRRHAGTVMERVEVRLAVTAEDDTTPGWLGPGHGGVWARVEGLPISSAALGLVADLVPSGMRYAVGRRLGGQSLDNSLRVVRLVDTSWYLVEVRVDGIANGIAHSSARLWSDGGVLLAIASQSTAVREF